MERVVITASQGMILTDGEIFGRVIHLGKNRSASEFREISEQEYEALALASEESGLPLGQISDSDALAILMGEEVQTDDEAGSDGAESGDGESGSELG